MKNQKYSRLLRLIDLLFPEIDDKIKVSYHDYGEDFYHAFLSGIFAGAGYQVDSNKEHGEGRSDVVVCDTINGRVAIFEAKRAMTLADLESACDKALRQIDQRMYAKDFEDEYDSDHIHCYGIAFYKKRCFVKKKDWVFSARQHTVNNGVLTGSFRHFWMSFYLLDKYILRRGLKERFSENAVIISWAGNQWDCDEIHRGIVELSN